MSVAIAFLLTTLAGLSTGIGSLIALRMKKPKVSYLCFSLGLSAGVMLYVSFVELLPSGLEGVGEELGVLAFFIGILFIAVIDLLIPKWENPHHFKRIVNGRWKADGITTRRGRRGKRRRRALMRTGIITAIAIGIHNFPEGLAIFGTTLDNLNLGIMIAFAIAIHNIPEGISVSIPIYCATGSKKKAFKYSFISGLAEPLGALIGYLILMPFLSEALLASLLAFVAGIMVYISVDEILPMAHSYGRSHYVLIGVILGMFIMAVSLLMV